MKQEAIGPRDYPEMRPNIEGVKAAMVIKKEKMVRDRERVETFWESVHRQ